MRPGRVFPGPPLFPSHFGTEPTECSFWRWMNGSNGGSSEIRDSKRSVFKKLCKIKYRNKGKASFKQVLHSLKVVVFIKGEPLTSPYRHLRSPHTIPLKIAGKINGTCYQNAPSMLTLQCSLTKPASFSSSHYSLWFLTEFSWDFWKLHLLNYH